MSSASCSCSSPHHPTPTPPTSLPHITICTFTPAHELTLGWKSLNVCATAGAAYLLLLLSCLCFAGCLYKSQIRCRVNWEKYDCFVSSLQELSQDNPLFVMSQRNMITPSSRNICPFVKNVSNFVSLYLWKVQQTFSCGFFVKKSFYFLIFIYVTIALLLNLIRNNYQMKIAECCQ